MRKHKGVTVEQAREIIHDVSYFGTMLVHNGMVDGMVSGATHTTAHTVRPPFRDHQDAARRVDRIQHLPDVPGGQVLPYGDCAIVPDPTSSSWPTSRYRRHAPRPSSA